MNGLYGSNENNSAGNMEKNSATTTVTVCVGSSCHIKGARDVIGRFNQLLKEYKLSEKIELKGSFCMERCGKGINWQIDDKPITSATPDEAVEFFIQQIIEPLQGS